MKALVLHNKKEPLQLSEVPDPIAMKDEVIVKITASALNHRDVWIQKGQYAGLKYPCILGSDGTGTVMAVGTNGDSHWIGKEVIINPSMFWGDEESHQHPEKFKILGLPEDGCMAEYVKVPTNSLEPKPSHLSCEEAAALPLAGLTAFRALFKRAALKEGEKLLITGIGGGVALFALQYAIAAKAQVFVTSGDDEKIRKAIQMGAISGANYKKINWVDQLKKEADAFDVIIDGAAGHGLNDLFDLAKPGGRIVVYGATQGNPANIIARRIFWKQLNLLGSTMGSPADFNEMIKFVNHHKIKPIVDKVFAFNEGEMAMQRMEEGKQFGKIVIRIEA